MLSDYIIILPSIAAVISSFLALVIGQFFKDHPVAKGILVFSAALLGAAAIGATIYGQHDIVRARIEAAEKTKAVHEQIGVFISQGNQLIQGLFGPPLADQISYGLPWLNLVQDYLRENLGESYVTRFNDPSGSPIDYPTIFSDEQRRGLYLALRFRLIRLEQFSAEIHS